MISNDRAAMLFLSLACAGMQSRQIVAGAYFIRVSICSREEMGETLHRGAEHWEANAERLCEDFRALTPAEREALSTAAEATV